MPGVYDIVINGDIVEKRLNDNHAISLKIKDKLKSVEESTIFMDIIKNSHELEIIGPYINKCTEVNRDGSYTSPFITGINLMDILPADHPLCAISLFKSQYIQITEFVAKKILKKLFELEMTLHKYNKREDLVGDWFLHNLIYNIESDNIINVDLEGFYTYRNKNHESDLTYYLPMQFDACREELLCRYNTHIFSIILWPPTEPYFDEILEDISENYYLLLDRDLEIPDMKIFVDKVYELDVRCDKSYLPKKTNIM